MGSPYFRNIHFKTDDGLTLYARDYPGPRFRCPGRRLFAWVVT